MPPAAPAGPPPGPRPGATTNAPQEPPFEPPLLTDCVSSRIVGTHNGIEYRCHVIPVLAPTEVPMTLKWFRATGMFKKIAKEVVCLASAYRVQRFSSGRNRSRSSSNGGGAEAGAAEVGHAETSWLEAGEELGLFGTTRHGSAPVRGGSDREEAEYARIGADGLLAAQGDVCGVDEGSDDNGDVGVGDKLLQLLRQSDVSNLMLIATRCDFRPSGPTSGSIIEDANAAADRRRRCLAAVPDRRPLEERLDPRRFKVVLAVAKDTLEACYERHGFGDAASSQHASGLQNGASGKTSPAHRRREARARLQARRDASGFDPTGPRSSSGAEAASWRLSGGEIDVAPVRPVVVNSVSIRWPQHQRHGGSGGGGGGGGGQSPGRVHRARSQDGPLVFARSGSAIDDMLASTLRGGGRPREQTFSLVIPQPLSKEDIFELRTLHNPSELVCRVIQCVGALLGMTNIGGDRSYARPGRRRGPWAGSPAHATRSRRRPPGALARKRSGRPDRRRVLDWHECKILLQRPAFLDALRSLDVGRLDRDDVARVRKQLNDPSFSAAEVCNRLTVVAPLFEWLVECVELYEYHAGSHSMQIRVSDGYPRLRVSNMAPAHAQAQARRSSGRGPARPRARAPVSTRRTPAGAGTRSPARPWTQDDENAA